MNKREESLELLRKVSEVNGISGNEKRVANLIKAELDGVVDEVTYDNLGSIVTHLKGNEDEPKVLLTAHMDEIGF